MSLKGKYIHLTGWMVEKLKLKGNELIVFALIYGFSQEDDHDFHGSAQYIADWLNTSKQTVFNVLKSLVDKGYIKRTEEIINNVTFVHYKSAIKVVNEEIFNGGSQNSLQGVVKNFDGGSQKFLSNNIFNNIENNIERDNKEYIDKSIYKKKRENEFDSVIETFLDNNFANYNLEDKQELVDVIYDFIQHRKKIKKPLTARALNSNISKALSLSNGTIKDVVKIIDNAIAHGWQGIYKEQEFSSQFKNKSSDFVNIGYNDKECAERLKDEVIPF